MLDYRAINSPLDDADGFYREVLERLEAAIVVTKRDALNTLGHPVVSLLPTDRIELAVDRSGFSNVS